MVLVAIITIFGEMIKTLGYLGLFVVSVVTTASVFIPVFPTDALIFGAGAFLHPLLVGVVAGIGTAIGEITSYLVGMVARAPLKRWEHKLLQAETMLRKYGFGAIVLFSATPLPMDIMALLCGMLRYDLLKFFLAVLIGRLIRALILAYAGFGIAFAAGIAEKLYLVPIHPI